MFRRNKVGGAPISPTPALSRGMRSRVLRPPLGLHDTWCSHVSCFPHFPSLLGHNSSSTITSNTIDNMTRSHKMNDREHQVESATGPRENIPRYFAKSGPTDADPRKTKKDGGGKGNWGRSGDEMQDTDYSFANARRRSNSSTQGLADFNTKFEAIDPEPVFEEEILGEADVAAGNDNPVTKVDTVSSNDSEADREGRKY
ncbi:hypothetical protein DTO013E5_3993 [Penicillium roqueforti]|nr:hypothetical protein DTO012A1_817 [Penicillium roqueforti]KAI2754985.1 hypothetical protein DTO013F2_1477 [Penicillium roqueforti]KAI2768160.1 hypothetical protein DTO012A8_6606 [Penicillium roqueforti]KAI3081478.1 hypothetical protein CBS147339_2796 [Penicillium roqueforti]KAI3095686.1 hypothetical protein CBS147338_5671 [Penicillium roqueforti]